MPAPAPGPTPPITPETVARMVTELVGTPVAESDRRAVADMLQSLAADMAGLRALDVGAAEPAFLYDAAEAES